MIIDKIDNARSYYCLGESFKKAFEYLQNTDLKNLPCGKYEIDGDNIFVSVQDYHTKPEKEGKFEAHKKYTDIQFVILGEEQMGFGNIENYKPFTFYDEKNDIVFLENKEEKNFFAHVKEGYFVIFMPQDAHMPCIENNNPVYVKKAVVKIKTGS